MISTNLELDQQVLVIKGYGALVLRLTDEVVEALFVTYDLWK